MSLDILVDQLDRAQVEKFRDGLHTERVQFAHKDVQHVHVSALELNPCVYA